MSSPSVWQGTLPEAIERAQQLLQTLEVDLTLPLPRTIRDWRAEGVLTKTGRKLTHRNVLELIRATQLRDQGYGVALIRSHLAALPDSALETELRASPAPTTAPLLAPVPIEPGLVTSAEVDRTASLLCMGIVQQFQATQIHKLVGIYEDMPRPLRQAQAQLSRMAILYGCEDCYASVHELLHDCMRAVHLWAPPPLATHPSYHALILIDGELMVPTQECRLIAEAGSHLANLIEHQFFKELRTALDRLPPHHRSGVYTRVRSFIAEHPLVTESELADLRRDPRLLADPALMAFLDHSYPPAHGHEAVNRQVPRCGRCNGPIRKGHCRLPTCRTLNPDTLLGTPVPLDQARIVHSELMGYWCDPAQEELRVFRELSALHPGAPELYPHLDACDIAVGDIGIDVKDHQDPVNLARRLNQGIGGLALYHHRYLAVATRRAADSSYIPQLKEALTESVRATLKVLSVEDTITAVHRELGRA